MINLIEGLKNIPVIQQECTDIMGKMVAYTLTYLTKGGSEQPMKELWVGIGIELDAMNAETLAVLKA